MIDKTAIVNKNAKIHSSVKIGPYTVIGPNVEIAENVIIHSHVNISGHTSIGKQNRIFPFASIGNDPQDLKYKGEKTLLKIGSPPEEIAKTVKFLLESKSITGQFIAVDGGEHLS